MGRKKTGCSWTAEPNERTAGLSLRPIPSVYGKRDQTTREEAAPMGISQTSYYTLWRSLSAPDVYRRPQLGRAPRSFLANPTAPIWSLAAARVERFCRPRHGHVVRVL